MKYKLIVTGTKEEIERAKYDIEEWHLKWNLRNTVQAYTLYHGGVNLRDVEFKVLKVRQRVKTLAELVREFGDEVEISDESGEAKIEVGDYFIYTNDLGEELDEKTLGPVSVYWRQTFLTEVID